MDSAGCAYVTGETSSVNFPTTPGAFRTVVGTDVTAFVTKFNAAGSGLADGWDALLALPGVANVGVQPSLGTGSLAASRGTTGVVLNDANQTVLDASSGNLDSTLTTLDTTGSNWTGSNWTGSNWTGGWLGSNWTGSNWTGSNWTGSNWTGTEEYGSNWTGSTWYGAWDQ